MKDITDSILFKEFPRVAPTADILGFTYEDVKFLLEKIENGFYCYDYYKDNNMMEIALKSILIRMDMNREQFFHYVDMKKTAYWTEYELHKAKKYIGAYQLPAYCAILSL